MYEGGVLNREEKKLFNGLRLLVDDEEAEDLFAATRCRTEGIA